MNQPYIKKYNENGQLMNPIIGAYINHFPNRRKRREKEVPMMGYPSNRIIVQVEHDKQGRRKRILHLKNQRQNP